MKPATITLSKAQVDAAGEFANAANTALTVTGRVHPPTLVAAGARMAGTYLFRSFPLKLDGVVPGQAVLSAVANERGPELIQIAVSALARMGIAVAPEAGVPVAEQTTKPRLEFLTTQRLLEAAYAPIRDRHELSAAQAAHAAALATALLVRHCAKALEPSTAFHLAAYGFIEGAKTAPDPVQEA